MEPAQTYVRGRRIQVALVLYAVAEGMRLRAAASRAAGLIVGGNCDTDHNKGDNNGGAALHAQPVVVVALGAGRPVYTPASAPIIECNRPAAAAGIRPGISLSQARRLCPDLQVFSSAGDDPKLLALSDNLYRSFYKLTPWIEPDDNTALFCRITGVPAVTRGRGAPVITDLQAVAAALCPSQADRITIGVAATRFEAKLLVKLAMADPGSSCCRRRCWQYSMSEDGYGSLISMVDAGHLRLVFPATGGYENSDKAWLQQLPVANLWPLPASVRDRLERLGLRTIGDVSRAGRDVLAAELGADGIRAYELAQGIDRTPVLAGYPPREITESLRLPTGAGACALALERMAGKAAAVLAHRLLCTGEGTQQLWLTLEDEDGRLFTVWRAFSIATARRPALVETARVLVREALQQAAGETAVVQGQLVIEKLHLYARGLTSLPTTQQALWQASAERQKQVQELVARLRRRFPDEAARLGRQLPWSRREQLLSYWDPFRFGRHSIVAFDR